MKSVSIQGAQPAIGPYSPALVTGEYVFVSGQLPVDPFTGEMPSTVAQQAEYAFRNVARILTASGSDISKTLKTTVFIKNMEDFAVINEVYAKYFSEPYPARSCVEVAKLPRNALIECEAIAKL